ncbi:MAG: WD40 repeat domain-containing protein [Bacteroidales bacterium]
MLTLLFFSIAFSPDGKTILTGLYNGKACLWNVAMPMEDFIKSEWLEPLSVEQKEQFKIE